MRLSGQIWSTVRPARTAVGLLHADDADTKVFSAVRLVPFSAGSTVKDVASETVLKKVLEAALAGIFA